ncbi:MAG: MmcQ/YjbR family DNA-binding protein [Solirubrobacteraceae bacterium]
MLIRERCVALAHAVEEFPFGPDTRVFKVGGKIFAILGDALSLKCEPELAESLRAAHPAIGPGYHLNKRHWNTLTLDGSLEERLVGELVEDSYDLVVASLTRKQRTELAG